MYNNISKRLTRAHKGIVIVNKATAITFVPDLLPEEAPHINKLHLCMTLTLRRVSRLSTSYAYFDIIGEGMITDRRGATATRIKSTCGVYTRVTKKKDVLNLVIRMLRGRSAPLGLTFWAPGVCIRPPPFVHSSSSRHPTMDTGSDSHSEKRAAHFGATVNEGDVDVAALTASEEKPLDPAVAARLRFVRWFSWAVAKSQ